MKNDAAAMICKWDREASFARLKASVKSKAKQRGLSLDLSTDDKVYRAYLELNRFGPPYEPE